MGKQTALHLPDGTYEHLQALVGRARRTATYYIREAIEAPLDDLEDIYLAEQVAERLQRGEESVMRAEEFWRESLTPFPLEYQ